MILRLTRDDLRYESNCKANEEIDTRDFKWGYEKPLGDSLKYKMYRSNRVIFNDGDFEKVFKDRYSNIEMSKEDREKYLLTGVYSPKIDFDEFYKKTRGEAKIMRVGFKRLTETAKLPTYAHPLDDAGMDFYADEDITIEGGDSAVIKTGVAWKPFLEDVPDGYKVVLKIESKSGLSCKFSIEKGAGVIDQTYIGEIMIHLYNHGEPNQCVLFEKGNKIAQGIVEYIPIVDIVEIDELGETNRGANGFGSTGDK